MASRGRLLSGKREKNTEISNTTTKKLSSPSEQGTVKPSFNLGPPPPQAR